MAKTEIERENKIMIALIILRTIIAYAMIWLATCGLIKLITLCFGWTFSWIIATGIWLILLLFYWLKELTTSEMDKK